MVNKTPDQTWAKIGPYCAIATWLKVTCVITNNVTGTPFGTNRLLNGNNNEVMVASTTYSYTYTQPDLDHSLSWHFGGGTDGPRPPDQDRLHPVL